MGSKRSRWRTTIWRGLGAVCCRRRHKFSSLFGVGVTWKRSWFVAKAASKAAGGGTLICAVLGTTTSLIHADAQRQTAFCRGADDRGLELRCLLPSYMQCVQFGPVQATIRVEYMLHFREGARPELETSMAISFLDRPEAREALCGRPGTRHRKDDASAAKRISRGKRRC